MSRTPHKLKNTILLGWIFIGLSIWSIFSIFLYQWLSGVEGFVALMDKTLFYQQFRSFQSLREFYPVIAVLGVSMVTVGVGFLCNTRWAKKCAFVHIGLTMIGGTALSIRCVQVFSEDRFVWFIGLSWILGTLVLTFLTIYLQKHSSVRVPFQTATTWKAYERVHWRIVNTLVVLFGISAVVVGCIFGLWRLTLLLNASSSVMVNRMPTTALAPKLIIAAIALLSVIIGVLCLTSKPMGPKLPGKIAENQRRSS